LLICKDKTKHHLYDCGNLDRGVSRFLKIRTRQIWLVRIFLGRTIFKNANFENKWL